MKTLIQIVVFISLFSISAFGQTQYSILIDPGHGGNDIGAPGTDGNGYPNEEDITLKLGNDLRTYLTSNNITPDLRTYMTRKGDVDVTFANRANMAKGIVKDAYWVVFPRNGDNTKFGVDFFFSIHCNADGLSNTTFGTSAMIYNSTNWNHSVSQTTNDFKFGQNLVNEYITSTKTVFTSAKKAYSTTGVVGRNNIDILTLTEGTQKNGGFPRR